MGTVMHSEGRAAPVVGPGTAKRFESSPPNTFSIEVLISARGRRRLLDYFGAWMRPRLEPLGDRYRGRKPATLDFEREDIALRMLFDLGEEVEIISPRALRRKLHTQAKRVVSVTG